MNRKILAILSVLIVLASISAVSAFGMDDLLGGSSDEAKNVTIDGMDFQIPAGFEEDPSYESVNEKSSVGGLEYTYNQKLFANDENQTVAILVGDYGDYEVTDDVIQVIADEKQTIKGIDGFTTDKDGVYIFAYPKDGKLVVLTATEDNLFEDFLIAE